MIVFMRRKAGGGGGGGHEKSLLQTYFLFGAFIQGIHVVITIHLMALMRGFPKAIVLTTKPCIEAIRSINIK